MKSPPVVPSLFAAFDRIRIINLAHHSDRRAGMNQQLSRVSLTRDPRVAFFPAVSGMPAAPFSHPGSHGCFLSFVTVLHEAADAGPSVLIFEDDCDFLPPDTADFVVSVDMNIYYGGYHAGDPSDPHDSEIIGARFMGFPAGGAREGGRVPRQHIGPDFHVDPRAAEHPAYDAPVEAARRRPRVRPVQQMTKADFGAATQRD